MYPIYIYLTYELNEKYLENKTKFVHKSKSM